MGKILLISLLLVSVLIVDKIVFVQSVPLNSTTDASNQRENSLKAGGGVPIIAGPVSPYTCSPYTGPVTQVYSFFNGCKCNKADLLKPCPSTNTLSYTGAFLSNCPRKYVCQCVFGSQVCYNTAYGK